MAILHSFLSRLSTLLFGLLALLVVSAAAAQEFPTRQITIVVPVPAGGGSDTFARLIAQKMSTAFGRVVLVDNRAGAGSTIGTEAVVRAQPDGHTMLYVSAAIMLMNTFYPKLSFDTRRDLAPITMTLSIPMLLVAHPSLPARNIKELVALAKAKPGILSYASGGVGGAQHLAMELLRLKTGLEANHVPYRGSAPLQVSLLSGETQFGFLVIPLVRSHLKSGRMRALGISARNRSANVPEIPTLHESGVTDYEALQWQSMFAPAKVPAPVIERLHREIVKALNAPDMKERFVTEGADLVGNSPRDFAAYYQAESLKWADIAKRSGAKVE